MRTLLTTTVTLSLLGCSDASLKTFNAEPTASITSHAEGTEVYEHPEVELYGTAADTDHDGEDLRVTWSIDGIPVCEDLVPESDGGAMCSVPFEAGPMTILLAVTDAGNATGTDSVSLTVIPSDPPDVNLISPFDGDRHSTEELISFRGTVFDTEDGASVDAWLESSLQGRLDLDVILDAEGTFEARGSLDEGEHLITLHAIDSSGKPGTDVHTIEVVEESEETNTPPFIALVTISPNPAFPLDALNCSHSGFEDADGDEDRSTLQWTINGSDAGSEPTLTGGYDSGDTVTCTVTPNDGTDNGEPVSDSVLIGNHAPSVLSVTISPNPATEDDELSCTYVGYADEDEDEDASTKVWSIDGTDIGTGDSLSDGFETGDTVVCTVTANDGIEAGTPVSGSVLIGNQPPLVTSVTLSPSSVYTNTIISSTVSTMDAEDDPISIAYAWSVNDTPVAETGPSLDGSVYFDKDDQVSVTVTPSDALASGESATSETITVLNTAPTAPGVDVSPEAPLRAVLGPITSSSAMSPPYLYANVVHATESAIIESFEVYGYTTGCPSVDYYVLSSPSGASGTWTIEWQNLDQPWGTVEDYNPSGDVDVEVLAGHFYALGYGAECAGNLVFFYGTPGITTDIGFGTITGYLGQEYVGSDSFSGSVTHYEYGGTQGIAVNYSLGGEFSDLVCSITSDSFDEDGDEIFYAYGWDVDGVAHTGTSESISGEEIGAEEMWTCSVTPFDDDEDGPTGSDSWTAPSEALIDDPAGCSTETWEGSTYTFCPSPLTRAEAVEDCASLGMELVSINSPEENDYLHACESYAPDIHWWIGLYMTGSGWAWEDGTDLGWAGWEPGEPSGSASCAEYDGSGSDIGEWKDIDCSAHKAYICESPPPPCTETAWYTDGDDDGYGDSDSLIMACEPPDGHTSMGGDCDDTNPYVWMTCDPVFEETCGGYPYSEYFETSSFSPELHIVGVYEPSPIDSPILVQVNRPGDNKLVLNSYEPVHWIVETGAGAEVSEIVLTGYNDHIVSGSGAAGATVSEAYWAACAYEWPSDTGGCDTPGLVAASETHFGLTMQSFRACYHRNMFVID